MLNNFRQHRAYRDTTKVVNSSGFAMNIMPTLKYGYKLYDLPNHSGLWPSLIMKLNNLARAPGRIGRLYCKCSDVIPSKPAALPQLNLAITLSTNSASITCSASS